MLRNVRFAQLNFLLFLFWFKFVDIILRIPIQKKSEKSEKFDALLKSGKGGGGRVPLVTFPQKLIKLKMLVHSFGQIYCETTFKGNHLSSMFFDSRPINK